MKETIAKEIAAIFSGAGIASALALGVSWPEGGQRRMTHIFLGQSSLIAGQPVDAATVFDLASLTKVLVTTLCIHKLVCQGKLTFSDRLADILPDAFSQANPAWRATTLHQLLNHASGLPAHHPYYRELLAVPPSARKDALLRLIVREAPLYAAGQEHLYSDLGFMLLGFVIERLSGESLDFFWRRTVAEVIGVKNLLFFPTNTERTHQFFAETGVCPWSEKILTGAVHDDNCRALGGVAGHAGLFGSLAGVMAVCDWLIATWHGVGREAEVLRQMCEPAPGSSRCLGFDSPLGPDSAAGDYFQVPSVGHLGFTGTSFWIDLNRQISVTLLMNRTIYSWDREELRHFRRKIYNCVMQRFEGWPTGHP